MSVARFSKKTKALSFFLEVDPTVLYRVAALPDELTATLTPDTPLTGPRTGRKTPLKEANTPSLDMPRKLGSPERQRSCEEI